MSLFAPTYLERRKSWSSDGEVPMLRGVARQRVQSAATFFARPNRTPWSVRAADASRPHTGRRSPSAQAFPPRGLPSCVPLRSVHVHSPEHEESRGRPGAQGGPGTASRARERRAARLMGRSRCRPAPAVSARIRKSGHRWRSRAPERAVEPPTFACIDEAQHEFDIALERRVYPARQRLARWHRAESAEPLDGQIECRTSGAPTARRALVAAGLGACLRGFIRLPGCGAPAGGARRRRG